MTDSDTPWEPPLAGTEVEHLVGALDRLRTTFRWKADDLDAAGLRVRIGASSLTLGGLLKHLALVEDDYFTGKVLGRELGAPWDTVDWDADWDWDWHSAADDSPEQLRSLWEDAIARSRSMVDEALADGGMGRPAVWLDDYFGAPPSLRWILCHMVEEYARHNGHADLLRESIDGEVGE